MLKRITTLLLFLYFLSLSLRGYTQVSFSQNHPELIWQAFETEHFKIIYHQEIELLANEVARIAEQVYRPITNDLGVEPPHRTPIVVTDYLDYSNGLSTPLGHYIIIWCQSENKYMTGQIKWLRAVVAHEFAHIVSFWAFRAFPGYWRELLALGFIPTWFLEGTAEYEAEQWCEHRDMLMRVVAYHLELMPYKKMTGFIGTDVIGSRLVYEQGHSLIRYIAYKFGHEKIREIIRKYRALPVSFNLALKRTIGLSEKQLFSAWEKEVYPHYHKIFNEHQSLNKIGKIFKTPLQGDYGARWSPDGKKVAIVGINEYDEGITELFLLDINSGKIKKIASPFINAFFSWSPDGKAIVYSQQHLVATGAQINDLFLLNTVTYRIKQLTDHERATDPYFSPDGKRIVYTVNQGSRSNLAVLNIETGEKQIITDFPNWTEVFTPSWSPDAAKIVFSIWDEQGWRDIGIIKADGTELQRMTEDAVDDRYPVWSPDGSQIAFISYRTGIPNLYLMNIADQKTTQITDTPGGVFNPTWLPDGNSIAVIAFEDRDSTHIVVLPLSEHTSIVRSQKRKEWLPFHQFPISNLDQVKPVLQSEEHHIPKHYNSFTNIRSQILLPYADLSEKGLQPGFINRAADPLGKHVIMTAFTYKQRLHFFVDYINQQLTPSVGINLSKTTLDHGDFLTVENNKNEVTKPLPLYENFWSGTVSLNWNINLGRSLLSNHFLYLSSTFTYRDIVNSADYDDDIDNNWAYPLLQGWTNYLTLSYSWQTYRPDVSYDIHPKSGRLFNIYVRHANKWLGSELKFSQLGVTGILRRELHFPEHVIAVRGAVSFRTGKQPVQSRLTIADNVIRGISYSQEGDQQLYSNFEYRFPLIRDFELKIWILYFERFCGALFLDTGTAWGNQLDNYSKLRYQRFKNAPWLTTTGIELRQRLYIFGKIPAVFSGGLAIDPSAFGMSNIYIRLGSIY